MRLLRHGSTFFVQQVAALVLLSTDNIIIARVLGAEQVTPYSVTWSLLGLTQVLTMGRLPYLWAAYGEALARGDDAWVVRMLGRSLVVGTAAAALLLVPLTLLGQPIIRLWAGPAAVPPSALLWWMAAWYLLLTPAQAVAAFLNASGRASPGLGGAPGRVPECLPFGLVGACPRCAGVIATVVSYATVALVPVSIAAARAAGTLRNRRRGS